ncbi:DISARM system SNF2-like helicase DrmD [Azospirillum brasilense]|uniref:DISARM system SNF2-like helicase DrmD n=1 Tax=Azospirillum brasilense TaxID=192 RepID=UPI000E696919|nr:DISARM system SNF2-like helicase DrmD [Azospirillum brasilense]NUB23342.1 helicase [Azospirillum brasilense]NUB30964.1 helicase [Azospirillum brasilense]RIW05653.1 helicase [Azospirillum brasilense]
MSMTADEALAKVAHNAAPEPGQLVEVRRRQWIVSEVDGGSVAPGLPKRHLVRLASIDEDALGEEIEVLWELEPGAHVIERAGLPRMTGMDDPSTLQAFLDAVLWGAATNADRGYLQAPFRSGVSIEDFQLDPLVRAIDMARTNLLIADDVGLGKTIEAGLVIQEMLLRHRARTVLVLCPASLQEKWRIEMQEKFGLEFRIVDTEYVKRLRRERGLHANPWTSFPRLITSMDWAKQGEGLRLLRDALPPHVSHPRRFDLLIIDEAHNVAPTVGHYAVESLRTRLVRLAAPHFQHKLFLTATPHDGYTESFTALLELLDDQRFARNVLPSDAQLARVMVRRLKSDLVDVNGKRIYPERRLEALPIKYSDEERNARRRLEEYIESRESGSDGRGAVDHFVHQLLRKRLSSSPAAFAATLERHIATIEGRASSERSRKKFDDRILRRAIAKTEENYADDAQRDAAEEDAIEEAGKHARPPTDDERRMLGRLRSWAQQAARRTDAKARAVLDWLTQHLRDGDRWTNERVILFTEYRATQQWMKEILAAQGYGAERLALIYGGMDSNEREAVKAAFQASPSESPVRILLATDAASEGIDLQNHCHLMIHLEIPYNPNVMEQRNGRIDRHGQRSSEVIIWHPVDAEGGHGEDILRALRKLEAMRADMGSVNPVIAPQLPDLIEGRRRDLDTRQAEARMEKSRRFVKAERDLRERVAKLHERLNETRREQSLVPGHIERAVRTALRLADKPDLELVSLPGTPDGTVFRMPPLSGSWSRCLEGLEHPYTRKIRPITFDHDVAKARDDVVLVHLNHRLVQMSLRLLRAEIWARDDVKKLHRVTVRSLPDGRINGPAVVVMSRLVVTGGNHHRLHEELTEAGGYLRDAGFRREDRVTEVRLWLEESRPASLSDSTFDALRTRFDKQRGAILAAVEARSKDRLRFLGNTIETRKRKEVDDIRQVLDDLERALKAEIEAEQQPMQLSLFSEDERTQLKRDRAILESRLARIPKEREQELQAIEDRHSNAVEHTFPVAVVLLVPNSLATEKRG